MRRRRRQEAPSVWDGVTQDQLDQINENVTQMGAILESAKEGLTLFQRAHLSAMDVIDKARSASGQSVKVEE